MQPILTIQEIYFIVAFKEKFSPGFLTPQFLCASAIVPEEWKLARPPQAANFLSEISVTNGSSITARPDSLAFRQIIRAEMEDSLPIVEVAQKFVRVLKNVSYSFVSINPRSFFTFKTEDPDAARCYIASNFLPHNSWQSIGDSYPEITLELGFTFKARRVSVIITDVSIQLSNQPSQPALLFSGEFHNEIIGKTATERVHGLSEILKCWKEDLQTYRQLLKEHFIRDLDKNA